MIVEFSYNVKGAEIGWNWSPLRVRYDKTEELYKAMQNGGRKTYGNNFKTADSNWTSIHNPITLKMICDGNYKLETQTADIYYSKKSKKSITNELRNFHNTWIKKYLISAVCSLITEDMKTEYSDAQVVIESKKLTLIDYAVGKGGDLQKWKNTKQIAFIFGIDINEDNIINKEDGAYKRFLNGLKPGERVSETGFKVLFAVGDSSKNIKNGMAYNNKEIFKTISDTVFGLNSKHSEYKELRTFEKIGETGFNISSVQFALHYFFKNIDTITNFVKNICECTKMNGYFIGGCYDGEKVFDKLKKGNLKIVNDQQQTLLEINKQYDDGNIFKDDQTSLGFKINVWQESIGTFNAEYLVNFEYFDKLMLSRGFQKVEGYNGNFKDIYENQKKLKKFNFATMSMPDNQKEISFLNRYFMYKKTSVVTNVIDDTEIGIHDEVEIVELKQHENGEKFVIFEKRT
jgi:hypothetical protein